MELKKLPSLLGNERGCGAFERSGEKALDEGSSEARRRRRMFSRANGDTRGDNKCFLPQFL